MRKPGLAAGDGAVRIDQNRCSVRARSPGRRVAPATAGMTTPAAAVLSDELTRERGDNSRDLLAVSWETEDQFLQLVTSGEELRPRRFGDLQPRLHGPGLGQKHAVCKTKRLLVPVKHAVCKTKRFLVSEKTCRVQETKVPGLKKTCCVQQQKRFGFKKLVIRPPKLISQNRDPHSAGISVKVGIPIWARLFMSRLLTNLDYPNWASRGPLFEGMAPTRGLRGCRHFWGLLELGEPRSLV